MCEAMAKLIAYYSAAEPYWEELCELYQQVDLNTFVERAMREHPECVREEPEDEEPADYEIQQTSDKYILCYRDSMDEAVLIYERPSIYEEVPF